MLFCVSAALLFCSSHSQQGRQGNFRKRCAIIIETLRQIIEGSRQQFWLYEPLTFNTFMDWVRVCLVHLILLKDYCQDFSFTDYSTHFIYFPMNTFWATFHPLRSIDSADDFLKWNDLCCLLNRLNNNHFHHFLLLHLIITKKISECCTRCMNLVVFG